MTPDPLALGLVALAGGLGALARHLLAGWIARRAGTGFPWGTLAVNLTGSAAIGAAAALLAVPGAPAAALAWTILSAGFLGAYTTVSAFALQTLALIREGARGRAAANVALTVAGGPAAAALGFAAARLPGG